MRAAAIGAMVAALACGSASAQAPVAPPGGFPVAEQVRAVEAIDGATFRLEDGRTLRLANLAVVLPAVDRGGRSNDAAAEQARLRLARLAPAAIDLLAADLPADRYRRVVGHAVVDGRWLQGELVAAGEAMVAVDATTRALAPNLLILEAAARAARRGLWAGSARVLRADAPGWFEEGFAILEGRVTAVETRSGTTVVSFGAERRRALTLTIVAGQRAAFRAAGLDPPRLAGATLRARGVLRFAGGPVLEVSVPEQIERVRQP